MNVIGAHAPIQMPMTTTITSPVTSALLSATRTAPLTTTATSWVEVDLARLDANYGFWLGVTHAANPMAPAGVCAVIKADAYGHGVDTVARRLAAQGVAMFGVFSEADLIAVGDAACDRHVLMLKPTDDMVSDAAAMLAAKARLHHTIHDASQLEPINRLGREMRTAQPIHVYLDTGLSRGGMGSDQLTEVLDRIDYLRHVKLAGIYSHFASAGADAEFTRQQARRFRSLLFDNRHRLDESLIAHLANTAGTLRRPDCHFGMVRLGLGLYGYDPAVAANGFNPDDRAARLAATHLRPVLRWRSRIDTVQDQTAGSTVGYNRTHRLSRQSRLALVPVGYAEGYPLALSNRAVVGLYDATGRSAFGHAPVVGQVNMDQIIVDVTEHRVSPGDVVELISDDPTSPCSLPRLAKQAQSTPYELLTRISPHVPRIYHD